MDRKQNRKNTLSFEKIGFKNKKNIKIYEKIYISKSVKNKSRIIRRLKKNKKNSGYFFICIKNGNGLLSILSDKDFKKNKEDFVIGIAKNKTEAFLLTLEIISDFYNKYRDFSNFKQML
ncbi:MAG: hypothetical protein FWF57_05800 [Defluviitaleaceae bacterium]|nr:hypothetical protein [Defluviitaleaceae bacterium]